MLTSNLLLLTLVLGTIRPFGAYAVKLATIQAAATETPLEQLFGGLIKTIIENSEKVGVGAVCFVLAYVIIRLLRSSDKRDDATADVDKKQLEIQAQQLALIGQGISVGASVAEAVEKVDGAIGSLAAVGKSVASQSDGMTALVTKVEGLITRMDEREVSYLEQVKKANADTYLGLSTIQHLVEELYKRLPNLGSSTSILVSDLLNKRGIIIGNIEGTVTTVNQAALDMFKLKRGDMVGKRLLDVGTFTLDPEHFIPMKETDRPSLTVKEQLHPLKDILVGFFEESNEQFEWFLLDVYPRFNTDKEFTGFMWKFLSIGELTNLSALTSTQTVPQVPSGL